MEVWKHEKYDKIWFEKRLDLTEYRLLMGLDKKAYPTLADLKKRVIEPTVKEVSEQTELKITETRYFKTGRKITSLSFVVKIELKPQQPYIAETIPASDKDREIKIHSSLAQQLVAFGFSDVMAEFYEDKYGSERIERNIAYMLAKQQQGAINDFPAYLNHAIKQDLGKAWEAEQAKQTAEQEQRKITAQQRELELTLREERSQRENDRRMQQLLKERGLDNAFDKDELSLALEQLLKIKIQK